MTVNMLGSHQEVPSRTVAQGLWPWIPIGISTVSVSALLYYHFHQFEFTPTAALQLAYAWIYRSFGLAPSFLFFLLVAAWSSVWLLTGELQRPVGRLLRITSMAVLVGIFLNLGEGGVSPGVHKGELGAWLAFGLWQWFGYVPSLVVVFAMTFASMLLATDFFFSDAFERLRRTRAAEAGVEDEVTDRLRSIGAASPQPVASEAPSSAMTSHVPDAAVGSNRSTPHDALPTPAAAEPMEISAPRPRRSYFERRRERQGHRTAHDDEWTPLAPESQEIDNAETLAHEPVRATDKAESEDEPRSEIQDAWSTAEALAREVPPAEASRVQRAPDVEAEAARWISDFGEPADEPPVVEPEIPASRWSHAIDLGASPLEMAAAGFDARPEPQPNTEPEPAAADGDVVAARDAFASELERMIAPTTESEFVREMEPEVLATNEFVVVSPTPEESLSELPPELPPETLVAKEPEPTQAVIEPEEPVVSIPRPDVAPPPRLFEPVAIVPPPPPEPETKQQQLFGGQLDENLVQEAIELVTGSRRASVTFLQRKLRIDYALAADVLAELAARGIIAVEGDATQGRVLGS